MVYDWGVTVVWVTGACWLVRYWATYLSCCVSAVVVSFGEVDLVYWEDGNLELRGVDQVIIDIRDINLSEEDLSRLEIHWVALNQRATQCRQLTAAEAPYASPAHLIGQGRCRCHTTTTRCFR